MAERLLSFLDRKDFNDILEIGCGTGFLTQLVNDNFNFKTYRKLILDAHSLIDKLPEID